MPVTEIGVNLPNLVGAPPARSNEIVVSARPSRFAELVDVANPLQHVPLVSDVYRAKTGDAISDGAKLGGHVAIGAIAGGPVGALVGAGVFMLEKLFGGDGKHSQTAHVGLGVRGEDLSAAQALESAGTERFGGSPVAAQRPRLSSAEFSALLASFETAKAEANDARSDDVARRMRANLDKLDAMQPER